MNQLNDQAKNLRERVLDSGKKPYVMAVGGAKGGIGKSTVAVNLACQYRNLGEKILLMDADYGQGNTDILLGVNPAKTIADCVTSGVPVKDVLLKLRDGLTLLPSGSGQFALANSSSLVLEGLLIEMEKIALGFDRIILDTGSSINERVMTTLLIADEVVVVMTPDPTSLADCYATIKMMIKRDPEKKIKVLVNRVTHSDKARLAFDQIDYVCRKYLGSGVEYWGWIPEDERVGWALARQIPVIEAYPQSPASLALKRAARPGLVPQIAENGRSLTDFLKRLLKQDEPQLALR